MLAPLIVFAYNRPLHLRETLSALVQNAEAKYSDLYIFIDGPKNEQGSEKTEEVFKVASGFSQGYFKNVEIIKSERNKGLAKSVISGVSEIINKYGKVIVTEDDSICSPHYLNFMNGALNYYGADENIWSVGGFTVPMVLPENYDKDVIKTQRSSSYAWGTWKDRWNKIDWAMPDYKKFKFDLIARRKFNKWGQDKSSMLDDQMNGRINSWAIRFEYYMYKNNAYNILPTYSLIRCIGHDGSGTHSVVDNSENDKFNVDLTKAKTVYKYEGVNIDERIRKNFCKFFKVSKIHLLKNFIRNI